MWHDVKTMNATASTLLGLALALVLLSGLWWLSQRPMFNLRAIEIVDTQPNPAFRVNPLIVRDTVVPQIRGNFFTVNLGTVRQAFESVPWVDAVSVAREWPNRLIVRLTEFQPLGLWGDKGQLLSTEGDVFTANPAEAEVSGNLPSFSGPTDSEKTVLSQYRAFQSWFAPVHLEIAAVELSPLGSWSLRLTNGMAVELGQETTPGLLKDRVDRLLPVYPQLAAQLPDGIASVDMRYQNGFALKPVAIKPPPKKNDASGVKPKGVGAANRSKAG